MDENHWDKESQGSVIKTIVLTSFIFLHDQNTWEIDVQDGVMDRRTGRGDYNVMDYSV